MLTRALILPPKLLLLRPRFITEKTVSFLHCVFLAIVFSVFSVLPLTHDSRIFRLTYLFLLWIFHFTDFQSSYTPIYIASYNYYVCLADYIAIYVYSSITDRFPKRVAQFSIVDYFVQLAQFTHTVICINKTN